MIDGLWRIPKGWRWEKLSTACEINPHRPALSRTDERPTSFVPMSSVDEETGTIGDLQVRPFSEVKKGYTYFGEDDVLFAKITPCMQNGKAAIARGLSDRIGFGSTEFHVLRPKEGVISEWIFYFVRQERFREEAQKRFRGAVGQQRVPQEFLQESSIPVPATTEEQRRIVAKIEALFDRIREAKRLRVEAGENSASLTQAVLKDIFDRPDRLPPAWHWAKVAEVGHPHREVVQTGPFGAQLKSSEFTSTGVPVLAIGNVKSGELDVTELNHVSDAKARQLSRYKVKSGDLLFTRMGTVGRSCVVPDYADGWLISYHLLRIAVDHSRCLPSYLHYALTGAPRVAAQLESRMQGATRAGVNTQILANLKFPLPPIAEQRQIIRQVDHWTDAALHLKKSQQATEFGLKRLEQSILDRAFRGHL